MQRYNSPSGGVLILAGLVVIGAAMAYLFLRRPQSPAPAAQPNAAAAAQPTTEDSELREVPPSERAKVPQLPAVIQAASRPSPSAAPAPTGPEPTPYARQL